MYYSNLYSEQFTQQNKDWVLRSITNRVYDGIANQFPALNVADYEKWASANSIFCDQLSFYTNYLWQGSCRSTLPKNNRLFTWYLMTFYWLK